MKNSIVNYLVTAKYLIQSAIHFNRKTMLILEYISPLNYFQLIKKKDLIYNRRSSPFPELAKYVTSIMKRWYGRLETIPSV